MKTATMRPLAGLRSATCKLALLALTICAPLHAAFAQTTISIAGGNMQSGYANTQLPNPLTVSFSGSTPIAKLEWQVTGGTAFFQANGSTDYIDPNVSGSAPPPKSASVNLDLGGTAGGVTVQVICTGCGANGTSQTVTFNETVQQPPPYLQMDIVSGDGQTGQPNTTLPSPLTVITIPTPLGFDGPFTFPLQWTIASGTASFTANHGQSYSQQVSAGQRASVSVDMGATSGPVAVSVSCVPCTSGQIRTFHLSIATPSSTLLKISGDNQSGIVGSGAAAPLVVQLGGGAGSLTGQTVNWSVLSGQATLSAAFSTTDSNGLASITFNYGTSSGPVMIEASVAGSKVDFTATALDAGINIVSGNNQTGAVGGSLQPFVIQITGPASGGVSVSNVPVNWRLTSGGGTLASATTITDANGKSANTLTLGSTAGANSITASIPGMGNVTVNFNATAISSASLTTLSGDGQTAAAGTTLQPYVVQVVSNGQSVAGIVVNWSVVQGGGTLAATTTLTDASGKTSNSLTLGASAGLNIVRASISGLASVSFSANATVLAGGNSQFTIVSGNAQALTPLKASQPLVVRLLTAQGQPVNGANVQWSVSGSSGTLTAANTITDASGQTQNQLTVVLPGSYSVIAQLAGNTSVPALTFSFNNAVANLPSLTPAQIAVAHAIDRACPALASMSGSGSQLTNAEQDLLQRCSEIVVASGNNPLQVPNALTQMLNNKVLPQNQLANSVQLSQFGNLNTRLAELRQGAQGISIHGLTLANDGQSLPLAMLGDMFHKDPKQSDDEVGKDLERWGFFATGMIERGGFSADDARPGFDYHNASLTAGVDYRFNDAFVAGAAMGYNQSSASLSQNSGKLDVDSFSLNGYFTWYHNNDFYIEGSAVLDWLNYGLSRHIIYQIAKTSGSGSTTVNQSTAASPDGRQAALSLSIGKDFNHGALTISPYLRGVYTHVNLGRFSETVDDPNSPGAGLGTSVESRSLTSELGVLGGRFSYTTSFDWGVLVPNATVEWNHEFKNDPQILVTRFLADPTQTPIVVTANALDQSYFNIGLGLNAVLPQGRSGFLTWEHLVGFAGAHENRFSLGIRIEF